MINECFLTAKIRNAPSLISALGKEEGQYAIRRALTRIARDARKFGGQLHQLKQTRVIITFPSQANAETMAVAVDDALNDIPVAKGLRIQNDVFVSSHHRPAEAWQQTGIEILDAAIQPIKPVARLAASDAKAHHAEIIHAGKSYVINKAHPRIRIGRDLGNDIAVSHHWVSRHHVTLEWMDGGVLVKDSSSNGTYIRHADGSSQMVWKDVATLRGCHEVSLVLGVSFAVANGERVSLTLRLST
mgnify:CR=1 FL=1|jgi:hypothetical protein